MRVHCIGGPYPNSLTGFPSLTLSVHSLDAKKPFAALQQTHQQLCPCTDSPGIFMYSVSWLIFSWVIFSWVIGSVSLHDLLDDPGRLNFDSVNDVFDHGVRQFSVDVRFLEPAPLPSKFPSVSLHLFTEMHVCLETWSVSCCRLSVVVSWRLCRATHGLPCSGNGVPWVSLPGPHQCATESKVTQWQSANPCVCWLES